MTWIPALLALAWVAPLWALYRLAQRNPALEAVPPHTDGPLLSVIIPARNESMNIEGVTRSVLASTYAPLEVVLVDDRSTDDTLAIAEQLAAADARVRVVRGTDLPAGWYGKPWACRQGAEAARGELLCFTDADTRHQPELLGHAVAALLADRRAMLTLAPKQVCGSFWERLIMPQFWFVLGLRYHPSRVNTATKVRDVVANGQFILVDRAAYQQVGGHDVVKAEVAEDVALAHAFLRKSDGVRLWFAEPLMETRMYQSLATIVEGWSKNVYLGARLSFRDEPVLRALSPLLLVASFAFWLVPVAVVAGWLAGGGVSTALGVGAGVAVLLSLTFWSFISFGMGVPMQYGVLYPIGALMAIGIVVRSTVRGGRRVEWRGRVYRDPSLDAAG